MDNKLFKRLFVGKKPFANPQQVLVDLLIDGDAGPDAGVHDEKSPQL